MQKFSKGHLSPRVPSEPVTIACPDPLFCMRSVQTHGVALPSVSSHACRARRPLPCSRDDGTLHVQQTWPSPCADSSRLQPAKTRSCWCLCLLRTWLDFGGRDGEHTACCWQRRGTRVLCLPLARGAMPAPRRRAAGCVTRKSHLNSRAALLKSPWKKADVPSSWHLYFYFVRRWIWLSCLLLFPAFGACRSALLRTCLAGSEAARFPGSAGDCRGEGLFAAWLCRSLLVSLLLFASPFHFPYSLLTFFFCIYSKQPG